MELILLELLTYSKPSTINNWKKSVTLRKLIGFSIHLQLRGGVVFFERLVRSVKEPLRKMLGQSVVNLEQLQLLLMEISAVIKNRPLTTLTEDPEDLEPLTPAMFLRGTKNASFPEEEEISSRTLRKEWERIQDFKNRIQSRFRKEYIGQLVEHKRTNQSSAINIGDIVLIGSDNKKRYQWPMGRVLEIMPSSDGIVRMAKIKTKTGCINRPLPKLYPLEMSQSNSRPEVHDEIKAAQLNKKKIELEEESEEDVSEIEAETTTRSGRKIKKPIRYGYWK